MRKRHKKRAERNLKMDYPSKANKQEESILKLTKDQPIADWNRYEWEELNDIADALGVREQSIIRWSNRDPNWPCGPIMRAVTKYGATRENQFDGYYLPPGSLDALSAVYPLSPARSSKGLTKKRNGLEEDMQALLRRQSEFLEERKENQIVKEELQALQNKMDIITNALKSLGA